MERIAYYVTDKGTILCDPCSVEVCRRDHSVAMSRTYATSSRSSWPTLTCDACGESHVVKQ